MKKKMIGGFTTVVLFGAIALTNTYAADTTSETAKQHEYMNASTEVTATVKSIDYKTRKITLIADGKPYDIVASEDVKNLKQIKKGDLVKAKYTEAIVYNINKGGKVAAPKQTDSSWTGRPGGKPEAGVERKINTTVVITNIDRKAPSVTFKGASGDSQTFKVMHPERLEGVNVGDAVDITYSQAMALEVEKKSKQ